jgi:hypothetical protein
VVLALQHLEQISAGRTFTNHRRDRRRIPVGRCFGRVLDARRSVASRRGRFSARGQDALRLNVGRTRFGGDR